MSKDTQEMQGCTRMCKDARVHEDAQGCAVLCKDTLGCTRGCKSVSAAHGIRSKERGRVQQCSQHPKEAVFHCVVTRSTGT